MGRPRKHPSKLPPSVFSSHGGYYHVVKGVWHPLGRNLPTALEEYGRRISVQPEGALDALIDEAFARMKRRKVKPLKPNTVAQYTIAARKLKHLLRKFGAPEQVKPKDVAMVKRLLAQTPNMANRILSFGRSVWADLVEEQLIDSNPFIGIRRHEEATRDRLYTEAEWDAIYGKAGERLQCIMDGLYLTDRRIGDVLKIDERDILDDGPGIYFEQQKTGKEIIVAWNPQLREWVARCRAMRDGKVVRVNFEDKTRPRPLFRNRLGRAPDYRTVADQWRATCKAAGVEDAHLHDVRAMSATHAKRQGLDPQKLLDHEDHATTKIYLRGREIPVVVGPQMKKAASA